MPKEPSYQGKTLTEWQDELIRELRGVSIKSRNDDPYAEVTMRYQQPFESMRDDAMPFLLRQLKHQDTKAEIRIKKWIVGLGWMEEDPLGEYRNEVRARVAFLALKEKGRPAVPKLLELAYADAECRPECIDIISGMGVGSEGFLDLLVLVLRDDGDGSLAKDRAQNAFFHLGNKAASCVPELKKIKADSLAKGNTMHADMIDGVLKYISRPSE